VEIQRRVLNLVDDCFVNLVVCFSAVATGSDSLLLKQKAVSVVHTSAGANNHQNVLSFIFIDIRYSC